TEPRHGLPDGNAFDPAAVQRPLIADLVHHEDGVAAVVVDGFKQGDRLLDRVQGVHDLFPRQAHLLGDLADRRLGVVAAHEAVPHLQRLVGDVPQAAADPDGVVVPQVAADLAYNHGHGVGGELDVLAQVKVVDG